MPRVATRSFRSRAISLIDADIAPATRHVIRETAKRLVVAGPINESSSDLAAVFDIEHFADATDSQAFLNIPMRKSRIAAPAVQPAGNPTNQKKSDQACDIHFVIFLIIVWLTQDTSAHADKGIPSQLDLALPSPKIRTKE